MEKPQPRVYGTYTELSGCWGCHLLRTYSVHPDACHHSDSWKKITETILKQVYCSDTFSSLACQGVSLPLFLQSEASGHPCQEESTFAVLPRAHLSSSGPEKRLSLPRGGCCFSSLKLPVGLQSLGQLEPRVRWVWGQQANCSWIEKN